MNRVLRLTLALTAIFAANAPAMDLPEQWLTDFDKARETAKAEDKPILAVFSAEWCGPCQFAAREVYPLPEVKQELEKWTPVYIDTEKYPDLQSDYEVLAIPTYVIMNPEGKEEARFSGMGGPNPAETFLEPLRNYTIYQVEAEELKERLKTEPDNIQLIKKLGDLASRSGRKSEALEHYRKAMVLADGNPDAPELDLPKEFKRMALGRIEFDKARDALTESIQENPDDPKYYKKRADVLLAGGFLFDSRVMMLAIEDYQKAAGLDAENATGAAYLAEFWLDFTPADAMPSLNKVPEEHREAMEAYGNAVRSMMNKGPEVGHRAFGHLAEKHPDSFIQHSARWFETMLKSVAQD